MRWPDDFINKIICDDCFEVMNEMPDNCIDTIITDPPYNLTSTTRPRPDQSESGSYGKQVPFSRQQSRGGFMGKNWDGTGISFDIKLWKEILRIAKPGATLLCFGGTRTYHRLACAIEDAGWILKDCIMWLYGSGFPKASDISKQIDKGAGKKRKSKPIINIRTGKPHAVNCQPKGWKNTSEKYQDFPEAVTPEATLWNGWKSHGLKPAYEPILVAMKPNEGSYANNALKWGVAGLNIDGGRIPYEEGGTVASNPKLRVERGCKTETGDRIFCQGELGKKNTMVENVKKGGRYPANVILDEEAGRLLDEQSGDCKTGGRKIKTDCGKSWYKQDVNVKLPQDNGFGASRFFYCAKASKAERNRGCGGLEEKIMKQNFTGETCIDNREGRVEHKRPNIILKNSHPTVKPLALMKYLCTLTKTPTGGTVLDPFCGSGTTSIACKELKRDYIGIDNQPEYCEIARRRVNATTDPLF